MPPQNEFRYAQRRSPALIHFYKCQAFTHVDYFEEGYTSPPAGYTRFLNNHTIVFLFVVLGLSIFIFTLLLYFNKLMMKVLRMIVMQTGYHTADPVVFLSGGSTSSLCLKLNRPLYFPLCPLTLQLSPTKSWTSLSLVLLQISSF